MSLTVAEFKEFHPAFNTASDTLVEKHLAAAERRTPIRVWADLQDDGIRWLTAHTLSLDPMGMNARKALVDGRTVYDLERQRLLLIVAGGPRAT